MTRSRRQHAMDLPRRHRTRTAPGLSRDELKKRRRAKAETLRAELANDAIDQLTGDKLLERFEPMPRGLDQLGDLPEPEQKLPYWVDIG